MNPEQPRELFAQVLRAMGADVDSAQSPLRDTPQYFTEMLAGFVQPAPRPSLTRLPAQSDALVALTGLRFLSMCEHHLVPFFGTVDVVYEPAESIAGLGGFDRAVAYFARQLQLQERMTEQLAEFIDEALAPKGVAVIVRATQLCMVVTGGTPDACIVSAARRGSLVDKDLWGLLTPPQSPQT